MSSLERKLARRQDKATKKIEKKMAKKLNMFDELPENCLTCGAEYDKKNREQATTWQVVIKTDAVRLYCPECWDKAKDLIDKYMEQQNERTD
jgi:predicted RNA-binding Zn-ribbon protein involved in translation (DUF1610 family)